MFNNLHNLLKAVRTFKQNNPHHNRPQQKSPQQIQQFSQQQNSYPFMTSQFHGPHPPMRSVGIDFSPPTPYSPAAFANHQTGNFPAFENDDQFDPGGIFHHHGDTPSPDETPPSGGQDSFHDDDMQLFPDSIPSSLVMMTSPSVKREVVTSQLDFFPTTSSALRECQQEEDDDELFATFVTSQSPQEDEESPQLTVEKLDRYENLFY